MDRAGFDVLLGIFFKRPDLVQAVRQYAAQAVADGWNIDRTYETEAISQSASLEREGFKIFTLSRDSGHQASIAAWGSDGLIIKPDKGDGEYPGWQWFLDGLHRCNLCDATNVETMRYGFAGRCCSKCLPKARAEFERPGWTS